MIVLASTSQPILSRYNIALRHIAVVHEARQARALSRILIELNPEVIILDYDSKEFGKLATLRKIFSLRPQARVIIFSNELHGREAINAIRLGVRGCAAHISNRKLILKAFLTVTAGEYWVSRRFMSSVLDDDNAMIRQASSITAYTDGREANEHLALSALTPRETDVAARVHQGSGKQGDRR